MSSVLRNWPDYAAANPEEAAKFEGLLAAMRPLFPGLFGAAPAPEFKVTTTDEPKPSDLTGDAEEDVLIARARQQAAQAAAAKRKHAG